MHLLMAEIVLRWPCVVDRAWNSNYVDSLYTERDGIFFPLFNLSNLFQLVAQIHLDVRSDNFLPNAVQGT